MNRIIIAKQFFTQPRKRITKNKTERSGEEAKYLLDRRRRKKSWIAGTRRRAGLPAPKEELASPAAAAVGTGRRAGSSAPEEEIARRHREKS
jgi:hypothetical protein